MSLWPAAGSTPDLRRPRAFTGLKGAHEVMRLDLADLRSVRDFAAKFTAAHNRLDGLACNAGMVNMRGRLERTKDGFESTIGVSYFGPFLLTELLLYTLKASAPSRMAIVSSVVHAGNPKNRPQVHLDDSTTLRASSTICAPTAKPR